MVLWAVPGEMLSSLGCLQPSTPRLEVHAMPPASSSSSLPSFLNCFHTQVYFSFWLHDLKAAGGRLWAPRTAKGHPGLGPSPQADVVMADCCHASPWGGCTGTECCQEEASTQPRFDKGQRNFIMVFLQYFKKKPQTYKNLWPVSYNISFVFPMMRFYGQGGWGLAAGTYSALVRSWAWRMLHGSDQTNSFHFWNKDVYVLVLDG